MRWINIKLSLSGGPDDEETISLIRSSLEHKEFNKSNFMDLYGQTKNLTELAAVIMLSDLLVCVDSAPLHIAIGT